MERKFTFQQKKVTIDYRGEVFILKMPSIDELEAHIEKLQSDKALKVIQEIKNWLCQLLINQAQNAAFMNALKNFDIDSLFEVYQILKGNSKN